MSILQFVHRIPAFEGFRGERYKYVRYVDEGNYEFLHDLSEDPDELKIWLVIPSTMMS